MGGTTWRNGFVNIAVPLVQITEPGPAPRHKVGNSDFSVWEDWKFDCKTLGDLVTQLKDKYAVDPYNISTKEGKPVYWEAMYKGKEESKEQLMKTPLHQMFGTKEVQLSVAMRSLDEEPVNYEQVPVVKVEIVE